MRMEMGLISFWIFLLIQSMSSNEKNDEYVTVLTQKGYIMGMKKTVINKVIYSFLGIPFAKPPIGKLRFRDPIPMDPWKDILSATKRPKTCYQNLPEQYEINNPAWRVWINNTEMSEDCLYLSIWTPNLVNKSNNENGINNNKKANGNKDKNKDVISTLVWIHGGGFTSGSSTLDIYNGEILARQMNVIVINIQYRLGPLGFLSFNVNEIPGNQGLMDQVMALQWINENIVYFGGNSELITLFGANSGAVSASFHLFSPLTKTLFNQAIMQSGSALSWWAYDNLETATKKAHHFANLVGCDVLNEGNKSKDLFECLRSLDPITLVVNQWKMLNERYNQRYSKPVLPYASFYFDIPFKPIYGDKYLPKSPLYYLKENRTGILSKRVMLGTTKNEGLIHLFKGFRMYFMPSDDSIIQPTQFLYGNSPVDPFDILAVYFVDYKFFQHFLIEAIAFEYELPSKLYQHFNWKSQDIINAFDNIAGDYSFKCPVVDFADIYLEIAKVYLYSFEHETKFLPLPKWTGVLQGQEIAYIFGKPFDVDFNIKYYNFTNEEKDLSYKMMTFWTNFAQTGHPNHRMSEYHTKNTKMYWEMYSVDNSQEHNQNYRKHIVFKNNTVITKRNFRRHHCLFWRNQLPFMKNNFLSNTKCPPRKSYVPEVPPKKLKPTNPPSNFQNNGEPVAKSSQFSPNTNNKKQSNIIYNETFLSLSMLWISQILYNLL